MISFDDGQQVLHWRGGTWHRIAWQEWMGFREVDGAFASLPYVTEGEHHFVVCVVENGRQACADRYDVSLTAVILRWLRYTDRRAIMILSTDGYANWAWSSDPAFKSGRYIKTRVSPPYEMPAGSGIARGVPAVELRSGIDHPAGVWFDEPVLEMSCPPSGLVRVAMFRTASE
jgi:hypothetical protein